MTLFTAQQLADKLEKEHQLLVKADTLRKWVKNEKMPVVPSPTKQYVYDEKSLKWIVKNKRKVLETHRGRGRPSEET